MYKRIVNKKIATFLMATIMLCGHIMGCNGTPDEPVVTVGPYDDSTTDSTLADTTPLYVPGSCDIEPWSEEQCAAVAASINNRAIGGISKIDSEYYYVHEPDARNTDEYFYNMCPSLHYINGRFYLMWMSGKRNEMDKGQRVVYVYSDDGEAWSDPIVLFDPESYGDPDICFGDLGFMEFGGVIYAYASKCTVLVEPEMNKPSSVRGTGVVLRTSTDGINWSGIRDLVTDSGVSMLSKELRSGRFLTYWIDGSMSMYTDTVNAGTGYGIGWTEVLFNLNGNLKLENGEELVGGVDDQFVERDFFQDDNGVVYMFFRCNSHSSQKQWVTFSFDEGESWSGIYETNFSDAISKSVWGRLPDGRYYCISTPYYDRAWSRNPLMLSVSEDGINFSTQYVLRNETDYVMKMPGCQKLGDFAYPSAVIVGDYMYIAHAVKNETIAITKVALSDIK